MAVQIHGAARTPEERLHKERLELGVDHALVGNLVGYTGNAAIGVSWQIFIVILKVFAIAFTAIAA